LLGSAAEMKLWLGDYRAAEEAYGDALALASKIGDLSARPLLLAELGWVALLRGDVVTAERLATQAAELAEDLRNRRVWAHALRLRGEALMRMSDGRAAVALDEALKVAEELGAPAEVAGVRCSQACLALEGEHADEARRLVGEATSLSALSHSMRRVSLEWVLGVAALQDGDLDAAEGQFGTEAEAEPGRPDVPVRFRANGLWGLAQVRVASGDLSRAGSMHRAALELRYRMGDRLGMVDSLVGLATAAGPVAPRESAKLLRAAATLRAEAGATPTQREAADVARALALIEGAADADSLTAAGTAREGAAGAVAAGDALDEDAAVTLALRLGGLLHDAPSPSTTRDTTG
jgi:tetratricopeptide (TPR) repeat protein